jgi:hypothetical protein
MSDTMFPYDPLTKSAGLKKFCTATAVADAGDSQALAVRPARPTFTAWEIGACRLVNHSGGPTYAGIGVRLANTAWVAGQITSAGAFTANTAAAQDSVADDFLLYQHALADGNGFLVGATEPFNCASLVTTTGGNQTTPALLLEYWNGSAWADLTPFVLYADALLGATGEKLILWMPPPLWSVGGSGTNVPATLYNLRVRHTVAGQGTVDPAAAQLFLGVARFITLIPTDAEERFEQVVAVRLPKTGAALHPIFSSANALNYVEVLARWWQ